MVRQGSELTQFLALTAPEMPGLMAASFRMADPKGVEFGPKVWVSVKLNAQPAPLVDEKLQFSQ